jgi:hypothetical protein
MHSDCQPHADANGVAFALCNLKHQSLRLFESYQVRIWDALRQDKKKVVFIKSQNFHVQKIYIIHSLHSYIFQRSTAIFKDHHLEHA